MVLVKFKVEDVEYEISTVPPDAYVFQDMYYAEIKNLTIPKTVQEAMDRQKIVRELIDILLAATVTPKPPKQHETALLTAIFNYTSQTITKEFFLEADGKTLGSRDAAKPAPQQLSSAVQPKT
jgi:hypothetical protein